MRLWFGWWCRLRPAWCVEINSNIVCLCLFVCLFLSTCVSLCIPVYVPCLIAHTNPQVLDINYIFRSVSNFCCRIISVWSLVYTIRKQHSSVLVAVYTGMWYGQKASTSRTRTSMKDWWQHGQYNRIHAQAQRGRSHARTVPYPSRYIHRVFPASQGIPGTWYVYFTGRTIKVHTKHCCCNIYTNAYNIHI